MASQGPNSPSTAVNDTSIGSGVWAFPSNSLSSNDSHAEIFGSIPQSNYLKVTGFGFSIPSGATIDGIVVGIERKRSGYCSANDNTVKIVKGGTIDGTNKATATAYTTTDTYEDHGSSSDLWGLTWTDSDINSSTFGVAISCTLSPFKSGQYARIDHVRITVYYTSGGGGPTSTSALMLALD